MAGGDVAMPTSADLLDFVLEHRWVWDGQLTKFFSEKWWERIPPEVSNNHNTVLTCY